MVGAAMTDDELKAMIYKTFDVDENDPHIKAYERLHEAERTLREADKKNMDAHIKAVTDDVLQKLYRQHLDLPPGLRFAWVDDG
jgi:hypothetical protein